ncbi:hypothetical protein B1R94_04515 [Mycolicibacterium litorale]|nr:hypothetical protein B1R94_04515 [Mycolicibacterium litorale]
MRAGAAAISLATTIMVLAATQPPALATKDVDLAALIVHGTATNPTGDAMADLFDGELKRTSDGGLVYANVLGGPVGLYGATRGDSDTEVMSVGDGPDDAARLAGLLDSTAPATGLFHVNYEYDTRAKTQVLNVFTDAEAMSRHDAKTSLDDAGGVDCTGAITCHTDPSTQITTVTYPDGVVAMIQRINDLTLVAYKTLGSALLGGAGPADPPAPPAPPAPTPPPTPPDPSSPAAPAPAAPQVPAAPSADHSTAPADKPGPRLNILRPAPHFAPGRTAPTGTSSTQVKPDLPESVTSLTETVTGVLNRFSDTVKKVFNRDAGAPATGPPGTAPLAGNEIHSRIEV